MKVFLTNQNEKFYFPNPLISKVENPSKVKHKSFWILLYSCSIDLPFLKWTSKSIQLSSSFLRRYEKRTTGTTYEYLMRTFQKTLHNYLELFCATFQVVFVWCYFLQRKQLNYSLTVGKLSFPTFKFTTFAISMAFKYCRERFSVLLCLYIHIANTRL